MRRSALAIAALVAIGTLESLASAQQIAQLSGPLRLTTAGVGLSSVGIAASCVVYLALGRSIGSDDGALRAGAAVGISAGLIGGTVRAIVIAGALSDAVARYAVVPEWFVPLVLGLFVALATAASGGAGAALAFLGVRLTRSGRSRPPA